MRNQFIFALIVFLSVAGVLTASGRDESPVAAQPTAEKITVAMPIEGVPHYNMSEYERLTGQKLSFSQSPILDARVAAGELPPVEQRLPDDPVVIIPFEEIGRYGGSVTVPGMSPASWWPASQAMPEYPIVRDFRWPSTLLPGMASEWGMSNGGKTFTMTFRKGLKWSDGVPFTSDDIIFWWEDYILEEEVNPTVPTYWEPQGSQMRVKKIDDYTVQYDFDVPYNTVVYYFCQWANKGMQSLTFLPKHALEKYHIKYNKDADKLADDEGYENWSQLYKERARFHRDSPTTTDIPFLGPWILQRVRMDGVTWERNPYYYKVDALGNQLPYIDEYRSIFFTDTETLKMRALSGDYDYLPWGMSVSDVPVLTESADREGFRIIMTPGVYASECGLFINQNYDHHDPDIAEILRNRKFKQALSLAIDRDEVNEVVAFQMARPIQATTYPANDVYQEKFAQAYAEFDPERANALLDEIGMSARDGDGFRLLPNGKPLTVIAEFAVQVAVLVKTGELIKEYWDAVGVKNIKEFFATVHLRYCR